MDSVHSTEYGQVRPVPPHMYGTSEESNFI